MLSCFGRGSGKRRRRRRSAGHAAGKLTAVSEEGSARAQKPTRQQQEDGAAPHQNGTSPPAVHLQAQPDGGLSVTVAQPSNMSDTSSDVAWGLGRPRTSWGVASDASFCSARSSFSSTVSSAVSDGDRSSLQFWSGRPAAGSTRAPSQAGDSEGSGHGGSAFPGSDWQQQNGSAAASAAVTGPPVPSALQRSESWERGRGAGGSDDSSTSDSASCREGTAELVRQAEAAHGDGQILRARQLLAAAAEREGSSFDELLADGAAASLRLPCSIDLKQLRQDLELVRLSLSEAINDDGWQVSRDDDLRVCYRHIKGTGVHSFRFEASYDSTVANMLALTREFDLLANWNRLALDPCILAEPSLFTSIVYTGQWMPFPLSELDLVVRTQIHDLLDEEGALMITLTDFSEGCRGPGVGHLPRKSAKRRRIQLLEGSSSILRPLPCGPDGRQRTRCSMLAHLNPRISHVPGFLISFVLKVLSPFIYNATKDLLERNFDTPELELPQRMAQAPGLYQRVDQRFRSSPAGSPMPPPLGRSLDIGFG